ncbi:hypothetical protein [Effusibacillus consociatus]|uniref:Uncharacterized protein n=1 Tax=Effusibacillus consociatus TaxID=1117041 RepID=A0ABV9Q6B8_9BACL
MLEILPILQLARQIQNWNLRVIQAVPPVPRQIEEKKPDTALYLRNRKHVFRDFAVAGQKLERAILLSGFLMYFQLDVEVRTILSLTLHEVRELAEFIPELGRRFPDLKEYYLPLYQTLLEIEKEILAWSIYLKDQYIPVPHR